MKVLGRLKTVRFDLPFDSDRDPPATAGLRLSPSGGLAIVEGSAAIRQSIMILLSTRPGERVMRPEYGCPLHRLAFEGNDAATRGLAFHYIRTALTRWEPRIDIVALAAEPGAEFESGRLAVRLEYRVRATSEIAAIRFELDLQGQDIDAVSRA